ncbi:FAD-dependent oxidoreductase [Natronosalvus rutilus]|uniref:FAD-dependent monooxygenase n=1 Tax=Natronosalvus rutilus TaxID=2953753 RepID=A0A9E7N8D8_9EURY|nr:FAD-dependent monooxygenase [Natronosalvus rutilus]UTF52283.1 FAD-dependent monooxygenase [Natronosalvus rutilus]
MTLATVQRYHPTRNTDREGAAVVIGGGMAGLFTARILTDSFREVTVIERDSTPVEPTARRGVPQGRHVHLLLEAGRATLEDFFPGFGEELARAGGVILDSSRDVRQYQEDGFLADGTRRLPLYFATRPLYEQVVRRRVTNLSAVTFRSRCQWVDYLTDGSDSTVTGVSINAEEGDTEELVADLVVDATGRTSRTPTWLQAHGYDPPEIDEVRIGMAYSTAHIERPANDRQMILSAPSPDFGRGGSTFPVENGGRIVTLFGLHGDHPPTDVDGLIEFAADLPIPHFERLLETRMWLSEDIAHYPFPTSIRRHYEDVERFPDGLLVVGDALASFNPIYGQGMSVAALEALILHHTLADRNRDDLARRYFDRVEDIVTVAWTLSVGGDFAFPQTEGPKPRGTNLTNRYLSRLLRRSHDDQVLREAFVKVLMMEQPPTTLFSPNIVWRVFKPKP